MLGRYLVVRDILTHISTEMKACRLERLPGCGYIRWRPWICFFAFSLQFREFHA